MNHDLVVRNGIVVDGSGRPRFRADIGVVGQQIATIGRIKEQGKVEIDADGHFVTPGFIDGHTHMDAQVCWDPLGTCSSWQGVTSVVMGNCGFGLAPCRETEMDLVMRSLERAEDISRDAMLAGINWDWETFPQYLDALERLPKGINYASYVGHSALRSYVMGERSFETVATQDDLTAMRRELASAFRAGAIGFSTSRSASHATSDDRPVPSRLAAWSEIQALVDVMTDLGVGIFELANEQHPDPVTQREYFDRLRDLAVDSGRPITFVVGAAYRDPTFSNRFLALLDEIARYACPSTSCRPGASCARCLSTRKEPRCEIPSGARRSSTKPCTVVTARQSAPRRVRRATPCCASSTRPSAPIAPSPKSRPNGASRRSTP